MEMIVLRKEFIFTDPKRRGILCKSTWESTSLLGRQRECVCGGECGQELLLEGVRKTGQSGLGRVSLHNLSELKGDVGLDVRAIPSGCRG